MAVIADSLESQRACASRRRGGESPARSFIDEYGCRRGWLVGRTCELYARLGGYACYRAIDWRRVRRFVFVCKGNICRSAYAGLCANRNGAATLSFGLEVRASTSPPTAVRIAAGAGIDMSAHRPTDFSTYHAAAGDLIVAFEPRHARRIRERVSAADVQVTLAGLWLPRRRPYMQDPYGLDEGYFANCFALIDDAVARMAHLAASAGGSP